jgi:3',5'-nucleoside bisphosphate phosphatase
MNGFDLHTHTVYSDGTTTPEANVHEAVAIGLAGLGVTDHDTLEPHGPAFAAAADLPLEIVPGVEFSAERDGRSVHVLGYWLDPADAALVAELARLREERLDRARRMVDRCHELGLAVDLGAVRAAAGDAPIGRPHVAAALVAAGAVANEAEAFDRYLGDGGPAYVEKHAVHPVRAVELLLAAGGVAVLAHPGLDGPRDGRGGIEDELVEAMAAAGLTGLEVDHPEHSDDQRRHYRALATGLGLEVTGGSDYHGDGKPNRLGAATTPASVVERLRARRAA